MLFSGLSLKNDIIFTPALFGLCGVFFTHAHIYPAVSAYLYISYVNYVSLCVPCEIV